MIGTRAVRALSHMDSSMCSSAPDPEMWIIQGTLAWRTPPVRTGVRYDPWPPAWCSLEF
uniref:Uncharacterized protein n=1 Tax=Solanum lycopersicum TaxID=4081 RepID=A0A3Q7HXW5_SOLLC